jgi:UPF0716 protein FxsA
LIPVIDKLFLLFIVLPLVELVLLTTLSYYTSLTSTILFIVITGFLGTWLARSQGVATYRRIQEELASGRMPAEAMVDGVLIQLAGVLLISPGVLTDLLGIFLMFPLTRFIARRWAMQWFRTHFKIVNMSGRQSHTEDVIDSYATENQTQSFPKSSGEQEPGI